MSQNEEIKEAAISTFTIPGRSRCARTEFKRERESQRAKKGAADPRKKSKLKVCCHFFNRHKVSWLIGKGVVTSIMVSYYRYIDPLKALMQEFNIYFIYLGGVQEQA